MGFEGLSCAIARVIINYHAYQTQTSPPNTNCADKHDSLEHFLNCDKDEINQTLEAKIAEATTGNNSSRLTLLQYMHFGIKLSEKARITENPDEIEAIKAQLVQFIQNLQRLFEAAGMFAYRTLLIPTDDNQSLLIYRLNSPTTQGYKLTQQLLTTLGLSPESTAASIQTYTDDLFLRKENRTLSNDNAKLETEIQLLIQEINDLEKKIDSLTATPESTRQKSKSPEIIHEKLNAHETTDWEFIPDASGMSETELENNRLIAQNQTLTKRQEETKQHRDSLSEALTALSALPIKPLPQPSGTSTLGSAPSYRTFKAPPNYYKQPHLGVIKTQPLGTDTQGRTIYSTQPPSAFPSLSLFAAASLKFRASKTSSNPTTPESESASHLAKHEKFN